MQKVTVVYGVLNERDGAFTVSFPDAPRATGQGLTRDQAIEVAQLRLRAWVDRERHAGREFMPRPVQELAWDDAVKVALQLGMELVAVPL